MIVLQRVHLYQPGEASKDLGPGWSAELYEEDARYKDPKFIDFGEGFTQVEALLQLFAAVSDTYQQRLVDHQIEVL